MVGVVPADVTRMRDQLFFEGPDAGRRLSRYWLLLALAAIIAAAGVVGDSTATVIGAMIVAPLMVPILGTVLAIVLADRDNLVRCLSLLVAGSAAVIFVGFALGLTVHEPVTASTNSQVAERVAPRLIDLVAALATGAVGSFALARDDISDTLPGVAIAISLVPPLAVVGLTLESGAGKQSLGALLLFLTNVTAILASGLVVMGLYRVHRTVEDDVGIRAGTVHRRRASIVVVASLVCIAVPLALTSYVVARTETDEAKVSDLAGAWARRHGWSIASVSVVPNGILVRATGPLPEPETATLREEVASAGLGHAGVTLDLVPSRTVDLDTR
jgi:uncharacterized hydrophobic protein (TIGR00271 family)